MEKIYGRINWNTTCYNGSMDPDSYLHTQLSRAICEAAYAKPLTVDELSLATGIPAMYIEDELPRLEYGDAIRKTGGKYATDFIILHLKDRQATEAVASTVTKIADALAAAMEKAEGTIGSMPFYGHDFGMGRLGYIALPYLLRRRIRAVKEERIDLKNGAFPPRKDGGYGWFIVEETADAEENCAEYNRAAMSPATTAAAGVKAPRTFTTIMFRNILTRMYTITAAPVGSALRGSCKAAPAVCFRAGCLTMGIRSDCCKTISL